MHIQTVADHPKKRGRPPLCPSERRSEVVRVRLTRDEADAAYRLAIRHGKPLDAVLRAILLRLIDRSGRP